ncbi:MAG TPA: hypothetical protein PLQ49_03635 [Methanothrix sp.]|nr:hypothetical protein [Methanothrix sp.]HRW82366.1 hypothetical protein [Methanothrix sp.]
MVAIEINEGSLLIAAAGAMTSAILTLIFSYLGFRVSIESRLKDLEHQVENLLDLEEAFISQEERIRDLEMMARSPGGAARRRDEMPGGAKPIDGR